MIARAVITTTLLATSLVLLTAATAHAGTPFDGKVLTAPERLPAKTGKKRAWYAKLRKKTVRTLRVEPDQTRLKVHFAAFFEAPLNDLEVTVKLYNADTDTVLLSESRALNGRGATHQFSTVTVDLARFGLNGRYRIDVVHRGTVLAKGNFQTEMARTPQHR